MIPVSLRLQNFLSYGDSCDPIDFEGVHVACLSGPNGHGKSAILDAITWALWGQARSNSADDLVRLGQSSMAVEFEFLLDGQRYRVIRKRTRGKTGQGDIQFQAREADGEWRSLSGQGARGTQERINQTLRMDYETFINSAFILQGRADEFTRKTPGERKRILGEILNLSVYDQLCDAARTRTREALMRVQHLELEIQRLEQEHARLPQLQAEVERLAAARAEAELGVEKLRAAHQAVLVEKTRLDARRRERDDLVRRLATAEAELTALRAQLAAAERRVEAHGAVVRRAGEIRAQAQELHAVCQQRDAMTARLSELRVLEQERNLCQRRIQEARHALETRLQLARQRVRELRARTEALPTLERDLQDLMAQVAALDQLREDRSALQVRLQELAGTQAEAAAEQRRCAEELEKSDKRFQLLKSAKAVCPVCEGTLPDAKRLDLGRQLRDEKELLKQAQGQAIQKEADAKRAEAETRRRLHEIETKLRTGQHMRDRLAQARQKHLELTEAAKELPGEIDAAEKLEAQLAADDLDPETRRALEEVERKLQAVAYDPKHHEVLSRRAQELAGAERALEALERAEAELPQEQQQVEALRASIQAREEAIAGDRAEREAADRDLARADEVDANAARLAAELAQAERIQGELEQRLGAAKEALERCRELAQAIAGRKADRDAAARDRAAFEELAKAFGRNGIQALIIENALPEIEAETNALLARMTDGQLAVSLETQRELKAGGQSETLEIKISDGMGARRYEMYSGGEAFRVNFAVRIALSRLLARRAGARLETLVIDEGFGSQDQHGRDALLEAIQAIQDDFAKVLVITHIDELKEAFPTRIEVTKGPLGSQVSIY